MDIKQGQTWKTNNGRVLHIKGVSEKFITIRDAGFGTGFIPVEDAHILGARMSRIYIAGPMTGLPELNFPAFNAAAAELRKRGAWVENPAEINAAADITWEDAMRADIPRLMTCDSLYLLPGWQQSRGAAIEHDLAVALKMTITYPISE